MTRYTGEGARTPLVALARSLLGLSISSARLNNASASPGRPVIRTQRSSWRSFQATPRSSPPNLDSLISSAHLNNPSVSPGRPASRSHLSNEERNRRPPTWPTRSPALAKTTLPPPS
ncbi:unnamed protein product [Ectocarpus sp. CCAP 1310/34]|nr:unnamed protein product [Ectocarpus sp. CCAP 1310/34]